MNRGSGDAGLVVGAIAAFGFVAALIAWVPIRLTSPPGYNGSNNPMVTAVALINGEITWTTACTLIAAALGAVVLGIAVMIGLAVARGTSYAKRIDRQSRHLAGHRELGRLTPAAVAASAMKLRPSLAEAPKKVRRDPDQHGAPIGIHVPSGVMLRETWEDCSVDIWGPRKGKTTARAIPKIVGCPGPILVTSRKGDIVDATRGPREALGTVWVFDPMGITGTPQGFWINLLGTVESVGEAQSLADAFCHKDAGARSGFFDNEADDLVANLLLAAAVGGKPITVCHTWATRQRDDEPVKLLRAAGYAAAADSVQGVIDLTEKTRSGIYGGAKSNLRSLADPKVARWLEPQPGLPEFDARTFPTSRDTFFAICEDGPGAPTAVNAAAVDTIHRCGEAQARREPGRRLDPPMPTIGDELANCARLASIPNRASYFGSAGMPIDVILQSYSQGVRVWGREGMQALWSAANIRILGGGVSDPEFLRAVAEQIGEFDESTVSHQRNGAWTTSSSVSPQGRRRQILSPADLGALPDGRMLLLPSGSRPALLRSQGWWDGPHAAAIQASLDRFDPANRAEDARDRWSETETARFDSVWDGAFAKTGEGR